jgi:hypothetical protein
LRFFTAAAGRKETMKATAASQLNVHSARLARPVLDQIDR